MRLQELLTFAFKLLLLALKVTLFGFDMFASATKLVTDHCFYILAKLRIKLHPLIVLFQLLLYFVDQY
ncbi:MAG: hypothetical protein HIU84_04405 [Acidobacteria bacterium]|nr:hypothetical protein [Acidobacteriota bacterium]